MFQVIKNEPDFFIETKRKVSNKNNSLAWTDTQIGNIRNDLAKNILEEQNGLCVYCEKVVNNYPKDCHIDHFKKREYFPSDTLNYDNLLISCNNQKRCAKNKDSKIKKENYINFINPVLENPEDFLEYTFYGELKPKDGLSEADKLKAVFTIEILNLNDKSLVEERKQVIFCFCCIASELNSIENIINNGFVNFITLSKWFLEHKTICNQLKGVNL